MTKGAMIIDSHHHFWLYEPARYAWIGEGMDRLKRDYLPLDLAAEAGDLVDGVISVQARQDLDETRWLLETAHEEPIVLGVVGWVPLADPDVASRLEELAEYPALVGIRHVLQDEPDDNYALRDDFNQGLSELTRHGLAYDILIYDRHLPIATKLVDRHPNQVFVLDHAAKPRIRDGELETWAADIRELAGRENCYCKLSGMVTEASWNTWTPDEIVPYFDTLAEAFGPDRLMFGSDWPVCLLACEYGGWYHVVDGLTSTLSEDERDRIWGGTAAEAYMLEV